eukprot:1144265-Pelagomonas_calceolata.AAC.2
MFWTKSWSTNSRSVVNCELKPTASSALSGALYFVHLGGEPAGVSHAQGHGGGTGALFSALGKACACAAQSRVTGYKEKEGLQTKLVVALIHEAHSQSQSACALHHKLACKQTKPLLEPAPSASSTVPVARPHAMKGEREGKGKGRGGKEREGKGREGKGRKTQLAELGCEGTFPRYMQSLAGTV